MDVRVKIDVCQDITRRFFDRLKGNLLTQRNSLWGILGIVEDRHNLPICQNCSLSVATPIPHSFPTTASSAYEESSKHTFLSNNENSPLGNAIWRRQIEIQKTNPCLQQRN